MKTFQDFLHIIDFIGNQTVQGPKDSFQEPVSKACLLESMSKTGSSELSKVNFFLLNLTQHDTKILFTF